MQSKSLHELGSLYVLTILGDQNEEVHGLSKACDRNQLCNQCLQLCVSSVQWMMGTVVWGECNSSVVQESM